MLIKTTKNSESFVLHKGQQNKTKHNFSIPFFPKSTISVLVEYLSSRHLQEPITFRIREMVANDRKRGHVRQDALQSSVVTPLGGQEPVRMCPLQEGEVGRSSRTHAVGGVCVWGLIIKDFEYLGNLKHKTSPYFPLYKMELYFGPQSLGIFCAIAVFWLVTFLSIMKMKAVQTSKQLFRFCELTDISEFDFWLLHKRLNSLICLSKCQAIFLCVPKSYIQILSKAPNLSLCTLCCRESVCP